MVDSLPHHDRTLPAGRRCFASTAEFADRCGGVGRWVAFNDFDIDPEVRES